MMTQYFKKIIPLIIINILTISSYADTVACKQNAWCNCPANQNVVGLYVAQTQAYNYSVERINCASKPSVTMSNHVIHKNIKKKQKN